jgi:DNA modification methylase
VDYGAFLAGKVFDDRPSGFEFEIPDHALTNGGDRDLFPHQKALVRWALRRGRAAIFADTGLGKTAIEVSWAWSVFQHTGNRVLILAPLCVAPQTVAEAAHFGIPVTYVREFRRDGSTGIFITNYEMLEQFEDAIREGYFDGVVLDESSILKSQDSKTRTRLIQVCKTIPYRLSCTATPAPNDFQELGNQAEFLGVMSQAEMLACFFTHNTAQLADNDKAKWRLKGHAKTRFWEWMSHWAAFIRKPSDLGFDDTGYNLPELLISERIVLTGKPVASTLSERLQARRESIDARVAECAAIINGSAEPFIVWCNLNEESDKLAAAIPGSLEVRGSMSIQAKEDAIRAFQSGEARVIVTKPSITGFGLNWQHCARMAFVGLNDSYEDLYQAIRRCYRFGQTRPVEVTLITADSEGAVRDNIKRKERQAEELAAAMILHMREFCRREVTQTSQQRGTYRRDVAVAEDWTLHLGDCVDVAHELPDESVGFSVFSPPFASLFTYSNLDRDMGNSRNHAEFFNHFGFLIRELFRVTQSGRNVSVHCAPLPATKSWDGFIGVRDFRGQLIRLFESAGFHLHSEVTIWKDPVVAMQRTKAIGLLWKQIKKNSAMSRQGFPDYVVTFRKPGEPVKPIAHTAEEFPVKLWQELASPCWMDIKQSNTLNRKLAREENDERHICPLQLDLIERLCFLWSSPGDVVFSPFAGIGSEGYVATAMGRRFVGSELKPSYFEIAKQNLAQVPRDGYQFPRFQKAVGRWSRDAAIEPLATVTAIESDPDQIDWLTHPGASA